VLTIPRMRIRMERKKRGWSQDELAYQMTEHRRAALGTDVVFGVELRVFSFQQVKRLEIEGERIAIRFDDVEEPLWWALEVLEIPATTMLGG
jgi:transcriptional regulator with XRE-family HTH domain